MVVHTFHLARPGVVRTVGALLRPPTPGTVAGLQHAECMIPMKLGASIVSPGRWQLGRLAMFAAWESEAAVDEFMAGTKLGAALASGWHVRLSFLRRWGHVSELDGLPATAGETDPDAPVVAVTLARLALPQVPRFIRWGKPVERFVRDHPGTTLALAAARPWRTISTFTVWHSAREMTEMVHGRSQVPAPDRHATAMVERRRKDFHLEFTTLRFSCISEHGEWEGRTSIVPTRARHRALVGVLALLACAARSPEPAPAIAPMPEASEPSAITPGSASELDLYRAAYGEAAPAFVFLHGGPGYNSALFEATTAEELGKRRRIVVYDRRGCGRNPESTAPAEDFTFAKAVADLDAVLMSERDPILVGHSFGGAVALAYLQARPKFTGRVVLVNAPISYPRSLRTIIANCRAVYESTGNEQQLGFLDQLEAMDPASAPYAGFTFMHGISCGLYEPSAPTEHARSLKAEASKHPAAAAFGDSRQAPFLGFHEGEHYTTLELGALVEQHADRIFAIYGREDRIISPDDRDFLRRTLGARYIEIPGAAHNVFLDQQSEFLKALERTASR